MSGRTLPERARTFQGLRRKDRQTVFRALISLPKIRMRTQNIDMKSKYIRPMPPFYQDKHLLKLKGARAGTRTIEEERDLIRPQAQTIIMKFGGARELSRTLKLCSDDPEDHYTPSTIYRWMYPRSKGGAGGQIPAKALRTILKCARLAGVMLTTKEIYPHLVDPIETEVD